MKKNYKENGEALILRDRISVLRRRREKINKEIEEKTTEFQRLCTHHEVEIKDSYVSGGYLDQCQYIKTTFCLICGKEIKKDITYGGFN
jgi:rRNA processing protein Krr1/Pno1